MKYQTIIANKAYSTLYYFLKEQNCSEKFISSLRRERGLLLINSEFATTRHPVNIGDEVQIALINLKKSNFKANNLPLDIVFEDEYILIVNKPAGLVCSSSKSHYDNNLAGAILGYMQKKNEDFVLRMLNRLDKDTSGFIIVAKDLFSYANIKQIDKTYHAICTGKIEKEIIIDSPIQTLTENGINQHKRIISPLGKSAKTFVRPLCGQGNTLLSIKIENGRTHQIRVHLSSIGHALLGDSLYGEPSSLISHAALICKEISFTHPISKKHLTFTLPYPKDFQDAIEPFK